MDGGRVRVRVRVRVRATIIQEDQLSYIQTLSSDFFINSYGESWDSSCEKS